MTKREKRLSYLLVVAIIFVAIFYLFEFIEKNMERSASTSQNIDALLSQTAASISTLNVSDHEQYALDASTRMLIHNPFASARTNTLGGVKKTVLYNFVYSGYIALPNKKMAIINNMEYAEGDSLAESGDIISEIHPDHVLIFSPKQQTEWELHYSGEDL